MVCVLCICDMNHVLNQNVIPLKCNPSCDIVFAIFRLFSMNNLPTQHYIAHYAINYELPRSTVSLKKNTCF